MKVTDQLRVWLVQEAQARGGLSYSELARRGKTSYQQWQRLLQGITKEIHEDMENAICLAFNLTPVELDTIAKGPQAAGAIYDIECEKARAVWRWLSYDAQRLAMIRAMGFKGELPDPCHQGEEK